MNYPSFADKYGSGNSLGAAAPPEMPVPLGAAGGPTTGQENPWSQSREQRLDPWAVDAQNNGIAQNPGAKV